MKFKVLILTLAVAVVLAGAVVTGQALASSDDDKAHLGVFISSSDKEGALISSVIPGSPADDAGLKRNDLILAVDGTTIANSDDLVKVIEARKVGDQITIRLLRKGSEQTLNVTLKKEIGNIVSFYSAGKADKNTWVSSRNDFVKEFKSNLGHRAYLGVFDGNLTKGLAEYFGVEDGHGVLVSEVAEESPADKAGIKAGDVIISVDGKKIDDFGDLQKALYIEGNDGEDSKEGKNVTVELGIIRDKSQRTINVDAEVQNRHDIRVSSIKDGKIKYFKYDKDKMKGHNFLINSPKHREMVILGNHLKGKTLNVPGVHIDEHRIQILEGENNNIEHLIDVDFPGSYFMSMKIDDEDNVEIDFNGKIFESVDDLKDYLKSDEFKKEQEIKKEKIKKRVKRIRQLKVDKNKKI